MNFALIFAGGTGSRMRLQTKPKQFLELNGKPIIIHTIEHFDLHPDIDQIIVVCIENWISHLEQLLIKFGIKKVVRVIPGGETGQTSIFLGIRTIVEDLSKNLSEDIVLIHDGVRPLVNEELISRNVACAREHGNAITIAPMIETVVKVNEQEEIVETIERKNCRSAKAPQTFRVMDIWDKHQKAQKEKKEFIDSASLMANYGTQLFTVFCGTENIKITTPSDFYIFRAIIEAEENLQIWGM